MFRCLELSLKKSMGRRGTK